jgi:hypothetical protein
MIQGTERGEQSPKGKRTIPKRENNVLFKIVFESLFRDSPDGWFFRKFKVLKNENDRGGVPCARPTPVFPK